MPEPLLALDGVETCYGLSQVLFGVSFAIAPGEMVTLMGRNGMGKTTTVRSIMGLTPARGGTIRFMGDNTIAAVALPRTPPEPRGFCVCPAADRHWSNHTLMAMRPKPVVVSLALAIAAAITSAIPHAQPVGRVDPALLTELHWRHIGPFRGGRTKAAAGIPSQPNVFYVGAVNGGVWKTTDAGRTWAPIFDSEPTGSIGAIGVAPSNPNVIYVGTGAGIIRPDLAIGDGMYKSTDAGKTWQHLGLRDTQMIAAIAEGLRARLGATWCISESGLAGPSSGRSGLPPGRTTIGVSGPVTRVEVQETGLPDREPNMIEFTTRTLRYLRDAIKDA